MRRRSLRVSCSIRSRSAWMARRQHSQMPWLHDRRSRGDRSTGSRTTRPHQAQRTPSAGRRSAFICPDLYAPDPQAARTPASSRCRSASVPAASPSGRSTCAHSGGSGTTSSRCSIRSRAEPWLRCLCCRNGDSGFGPARSDSGEGYFGRYPIMLARLGPIAHAQPKQTLAALAASKRVHLSDSRRPCHGRQFRMPVRNVGVTVRFTDTHAPFRSTTGYFL